MEATAAFCMAYWLNCRPTTRHVLQVNLAR
jgi:hypothetical protein